jgi:hypothetical protein
MFGFMVRSSFFLKDTPFSKPTCLVLRCVHPTVQVSKIRHPATSAILCILGISAESPYLLDLRFK